MFLMAPLFQVLDAKDAKGDNDILLVTDCWDDHLIWNLESFPPLQPPH